MPNSMTGYGKGTAAEDNFYIQVEIKTVNSKYLDLNFRLPNDMLSLENEFGRKIKKKIKRGRVDLYFSHKYFEDSKEVEIDWNLAEKLVREFKKLKSFLKKDLRIKGKPTFDQIISQPGVVNFKENHGDEKFQERALEALDLALDDLLKMRRFEGERLKEDILDQLSHMDESLAQLKRGEKSYIEAYKNRLRSRIEEMVSSSVDEDRILTEVAVFSEKADINEEIKRLESHIDQMRRILEEEGAIGKKCDFLAQEMNRELNTLSSKSNDENITYLALDMRNRVEKIREQVQNIE